MHGDYRTVAHIDPDRTVTFYDADMPESVRAQIVKIAETQNLSVSATQDAPVFSAPPKEEAPSRNEAVGEMLAQAEAIAARDAVEPYERFSLVETEGGYAVWDDIKDGYYVDGDGVTEEFSSRWQAEDYLAQVRKETADREAEEWLYVERAKQAPMMEPEAGKQPEESRTEPVETEPGEQQEPAEPLEQKSQPEQAEKGYSYATGDTVYLDGTVFEIEQVGMFDVHLRDLNAVYPISRAENRQNFEAMLWSDARNAQYLPSNAQTVVATPNMEITVSSEEAEALEPQLEQAGIGTAKFVHEDGAVTFSFHASDKEAVEGLVERLDEAAVPQVEPETKPEPQITEETVAYYSGEKNRLPFDVEIRRMRFGEPERAPEAEQVAGVPAVNYRILDDHLGEGGPKEKFWRNVKAIAVLKQVEAEGRPATPEEQHILSQYVGWGGLADAFDFKKDAWAAEYAELKGILTDEEYAAARGSTLNAHYTSPTVIRAVYDAVAQMGFTAGNILDSKTLDLIQRYRTMCRIIVKKRSVSEVFRTF